MQSIIVHGGAGDWGAELPTAREGLLLAIRKGNQYLRMAFGALAGCEGAIKVLEDLPIFNAGLGSALNLEGVCEMDASIMNGTTFQAGACAGIRRIKHPITLARKIMEDTQHIFLIQEGAEKLADRWGLDRRDPRTDRRIEQWTNLKETAAVSEVHPESFGETVGCVTLDQNGEIVSGTSTGGTSFKLPGRVGDTPIIGAGTYATAHAGASATGDGEGIMRVLLAKEVCDLIEKGLPPQQACDSALETLKRKTQREAGVIALSLSGEVGIAYNSKNLPNLYWQEGMEQPGKFISPQTFVSVWAPGAGTLSELAYVKWNHQFQSANLVASSRSGNFSEVASSHQRLR